MLDLNKPLNNCLSPKTINLLSCLSALSFFLYGFAIIFRGFFKLSAMDIHYFEFDSTLFFQGFAVIFFGLLFSLLCNVVLSKMTQPTQP